RNRTPDQLKCIRAAVYEAEKAEHGGDRKSSEISEEKSKVQIAPLISTAEKIGAEFGVSQDTIKRDVKFAAAMSVIGQHAPEVKSQLMKSKVKHTDAQVLKFSTLPERTIKRAAELIAGGTAKTLKDALERVSNIGGGGSLGPPQKP